MNYISVAERCLRDEAESILALIPTLGESFNASVNLILNCKGKVIVTGVGKSGHIGAKIAATLSSTGTPAFYANPLDIYHGDLGVITNKDVVIAISNSGQTDELLRFLPYFKEENIPLIAITGNNKSLLAKNATQVLYVHVEREACPMNLAPTSSTTASLAMGDALAGALIEARNFKPRDFARFHPGGTLGRLLLVSASDIMRTTDLPVISPEISLGKAIVHISNCKLGLCVALDNDKKVCGIITDGDIRRAIEQYGADFFDIPVFQVMSANPVTISAEMKVGQIVSLMHKRKIHAVLVVDKNHNLTGIVDSFACGE